MAIAIAGSAFTGVRRALATPTFTQSTLSGMWNLRVSRGREGSNC